MTLPLNVDSLDKVPENVREHYVATEGGKFRLQADGLDEETKGLHNGLKAEREINKALKALGKTPEEIAALIAKSAEPNTDAALFKTTLEQKETAWLAERTTITSERDAAKTSEREAIMNATLAAALAAARATAEGLDLLPEKLAKRIQFDVVDGKRVITVLAPDGKTPMAGKGPGGVATIGDLVASATQSFPSLFMATGASGGGKHPSSHGSAKIGALTRAEHDALPPGERAGAVRARGMVD